MISPHMLTPHDIQDVQEDAIRAWVTSRPGHIYIYVNFLAFKSRNYTNVHLLWFVCVFILYTDMMIL